MQCHFHSHLLSPATRWAHYSLFCPHSLTVILPPWPLYCFLFCTCSHHISDQTLLFKLSLLWLIPAFLALPPRINFQTILWACCMLNSLQLCLLETMVFFIEMNRSIALSCMLNSSLSLKQFGSVSGIGLLWSHAPLPVSLSLMPPSLLYLCLCFFLLVVLIHHIFSKKLFMQVVSWCYLKACFEGLSYLSRFRWHEVKAACVKMQKLPLQWGVRD